MPKPRRDPYVPMDATIRRNAKLAALPSDTARLGWLYVGLGDAKLQRPSGCFRSRAHWNEVAGRFARHLRDYLAVGLIEEAGRLCDRCSKAWPALPAGALVVHDWKRHNTDPGAADRADRFRSDRPDDDANERGSIADQTVNERRLNGDRTPIEQDDAVDLARDPAGPRGGNPNPKGNRKRNGEEEGSTRPSSPGGARAEGPVDPVADDGPDPAGWLS